MRSQSLNQFLHFEPVEPTQMGAAYEQLKGQHEFNFRRAVRGREAVYAEIENGQELACLLLHAVGFGITKEFPVKLAYAVAELQKTVISKTVGDLLSNAHATEYFSKAVRADYDNIHLAKQIPAERPYGLSSDQIDYPRVSHHFAPSATKYYPFFSTLFMHAGRLRSCFEVMMEADLKGLRSELFQALGEQGLSELVENLAKSILVRANAPHPGVAQGKQMAVPISESSIRDDNYLVVTPAPAVRMIYALDQAMERHWGSEWRGYQHMRIGGSKPHNMGSTVTNMGTKVGGEGNVNIRPMRAYVPALRARLFASEDQLRNRSLAYSSALNVRDLQRLSHFREPFVNIREFKRWVALLPAALMTVIEPLVQAGSQTPESMAELAFKYEIEKQFVCKTRPEHLLGRRTNTQSFEVLGQHIASMIEARLMIYKEFSAGLGVRRKMAIARAATSLSRSLL